MRFSRRISALLLLLAMFVVLLCSCTKTTYEVKNEVNGDYSYTKVPSIFDNSSFSYGKGNAADYIKTDAVRVGERVINAVELNYYYVDAIDTYYCECFTLYSPLLGYNWSVFLGFDTAKPLGEQTYDAEAGTTWSDHFIGQALTNIQTTYAIYDEAVRNAYVLPEDAKAEVDARVAAMSHNAQTYGYKTLDAYLENVYGAGAAEESYRTYLETTVLVDAYLDSYRDGLSFDSAALAAYDAKAPYRYNSYNYCVYTLSVSDFYAEDAVITDIERLEAYRNARKYADELAAGNYDDLDAFRAAVNDKEKLLSCNSVLYGKLGIGNASGSIVTTGNPSGSFVTNSSTEIGLLYRDWIVGKQLKDGVDENADHSDEDYEYVTRKCGDTVVFTSPVSAVEEWDIKTIYVVCYGSVEDNHFPLRSIRLLSLPASLTNTEAETFSSVEDKAQDLLAKFKSNPTEAYFSELVRTEANADDKANGGLYKYVLPDQLDSSLVDWCYNSERSVGDCDMIRTSGNQYYLIYYRGTSDTTYRSYMLENDLRNETYDAWYAALVERVVASTQVELLSSKYVNTGITIGS